MSDSVMPRLQSLVSCLCVIALSWVTDSSATRYVYRIGGEGLPETEFPAGWDVQFVPLTWDDVNENLFGASSLTELTGGSLRPVGLDPEVNLTPQIRESGGFIKSPDGYSFKDEATLDLLFDGDDNTAYSGGGSQFSSHGSCIGIPPETETAGGYNARKCASTDRIFLRFGTSKGIHFNLGGRLPIRRIEFYPSPRYESERFIKNFLIGSNDGNDLLEGTREAAFWVGRYGLFVDFEVRHLVFGNNTSRVVLDMEDVPIQNIVFESTVGEWEIAELQDLRRRLCARSVVHVEYHRPRRVGGAGQPVMVRHAALGHRRRHEHALWRPARSSFLLAQDLPR